MGLVLLGLAAGLFVLLAAAEQSGAATASFSGQGTLTHRTTYDFSRHQFNYEPVRDAIVYYTGITDPSLFQETRSDANGRYSLSFPSAGVYELVIISAGHRIIKEQTAVNSSFTRDFTLVWNTKNVKVIVQGLRTTQGGVAERWPLPYAVVDYGRGKVLTDETGQAVIDGIPPGKHYFTARAPFHLPVAKSVYIEEELCDNREPHSVILELPPCPDWLSDNFVPIDDKGSYVRYFDWPFPKKVLEVYPTQEDLQDGCLPITYAMTGSGSRVHWGPWASRPGVIDQIDATFKVYDIMSMVAGLIGTDAPGAEEAAELAQDVADFALEQVQQHLGDEANADGSHDYFLSYMVMGGGWVWNKPVDWAFAGYISDRGEIEASRDAVGLGLLENITPPYRAFRNATMFWDEGSGTYKHLPPEYMDAVTKPDLELAGIHVTPPEDVASVKAAATWTDGSASWLGGVYPSGNHSTAAVTAGQETVVQVRVANNSTIQKRAPSVQLWYRKNPDDRWQLIGGDAVYRAAMPIFSETAEIVGQKWGKSPSDLVPIGFREGETIAFCFTPAWDPSLPPDQPQEHELKAVISYPDSQSAKPDYKPQNDTAVMKILVYPPALDNRCPDLKAESLQVTVQQPWAGQNQFYAAYRIEVKNAGFEPAKDYSVVGYLDGRQVCGQYVTGTAEHPALGPNQTAVFDLVTTQMGAGGFFGSGQHTAKVEVVPYPAVGFRNERNLDNNELTVSFSAYDTHAPVIESVYPSGGTFGPSWVTLRAVTDEPAAVRYSSTPGSYDQMTGQLTPGWNDADLANALGPVEFSHTATIYEAQPGSRTYYLLAKDRDGNISQPKTISYDIGAVDLAVYEFKATPSPITAGQPMTITLKIKNLGSASTNIEPFYAPMAVLGRVDGNGPGWIYGEPFLLEWSFNDLAGSPKQLAPGQVATFTYTFNAPPVVGSYSLSAELDPGGYITEQNENNNRGSCSFTVNSGAQLLGSWIEPLAPVQKTTGFNVGWGGTATATKYRVQYSSSANGSVWSSWQYIPGISEASPTTAKSVYFSGTDGMHYRFRVQAGDNQGNWHPFPEWPSEMIKETQVDTSQLSAWVTNGRMTEFTVNWTPATEAPGTMTDFRLSFYPPGQNYATNPTPYFKYERGVDPDYKANITSITFSGLQPDSLYVVEMGRDRAVGSTIVHDYACAGYRTPAVNNTLDAWVDNIGRNSFTVHWTPGDKFSYIVIRAVYGPAEGDSLKQLHGTISGGAEVIISNAGTTSYTFSGELLPGVPITPNTTYSLWLKRVNTGIPGTDDAVLTVTTAPYPLTVKCLDNATDQPLAGVTVTVSGQGQNLTGVTDAAGQVVFNPLPGNYRVSADGSANWYTVPGSSWQDVQISNDPGVTAYCSFRFTKAGRVSAHLWSGYGYIPEVDVQWCDQITGRTYTGTTDWAGRCDLIIPAGTYKVKFYAGKYDGQTVEYPYDVTVKWQQETPHPASDYAAFVNYYLQPNGRILVGTVKKQDLSGTVVPVPGARFHLGDTAVNAGPDGSFKVCRLAPGNYTVAAAVPGCEPYSAAVDLTSIAYCGHDIILLPDRTPPKPPVFRTYIGASKATAEKGAGGENDAVNIELPKTSKNGETKAETSGSAWVTNQRVIRVTGKAEAGSTVRIFNKNGSLVGSQQLVEGESAFDISIPIEPKSINVFTADAADVAGNTSQPARLPEVFAQECPVVPPAQPLLDVQEITVYVPHFLITGKADPNNLIKVFNNPDGKGKPKGEPAAVCQLTGGRQQFEALVSLKEGGNTFLITATDAAGYTSTPARVNIVYLNEKPVRPAVSRPMQSVVTDQLRYLIKGTALPDHKVILYRRSAGGQMSQVSTVNALPNGLFEFDAELLKDQTNNFAVGMEDSDGITGVPPIIQDAAPPVIRITEPEKTDVVQQGFRFAAYVSDAGPVECKFLFRPTGSESWQELGAVNEGAGIYRADWGNAVLLPGEYELKAAAVDGFGRQAESETARVQVPAKVIGPTVYGQVVIEGGGITGSLKVLFKDSEGREWVALTGDEGSFAVALPAGKYSATVTPPGCTTAVYKFIVSPEAEKNEFIKLVCRLEKPLLTLKEAKENLNTLLKMQSIPEETKPEETSSSGGGSGGGSEYADKEPPAAVSSNPADQETGVSVNSLITVNFNESVREGAYFNDIALRAGETAVAAAYSVSGNTLTITPSAGLDYGTEYTVVIPAGAVQDAAGNELETEYTFSFTTEDEPDTEPPAVTATSPESGATGVAVSTAVTVTFSEAVHEGPNIGNVALRADETVVDAVYAVNGDTLTITPSASLDYGTEYTAVIPAGAVEDAAGNELETEYTFSFTTEDEIYNLPDDFSGTQGQNNWYYYGEAGGYYLLHYDDYVEPWWTDGVDTWNTDSSRYLQIAPDFIQTGEGSNTAAGWQAPRAGTVSITGTMTMNGNYQGGWNDDGINFSVRKNSETIAGPVWVYHLEGYNTGTLSLDIDVAEGDMIYFYQDRRNWQDCDAASYDFTVRYTEEPAEEGY
ncbi:MAG: Ig-like domain-containing protein [Bacillota bacterium]